MRGNVCECARVYHRLHQLHLMGHTSDTSHLLGLYLAITSINLAESAPVGGKQFGSGYLFILKNYVYRPEP